MNVQTTWHILYIDDSSNMAVWKYYGPWGGADEHEAVKKSKIESSMAFTRLAIFRITDTKLFKRTGLVEYEWETPDVVA